MYNPITLALQTGKFEGILGIEIEEPKQRKPLKQQYRYKMLYS